MYAFRIYLNVSVFFSFHFAKLRGDNVGIDWRWIKHLHNFKYNYRRAEIHQDNLEIKSRLMNDLSYRTRSMLRRVWVYTSDDAHDDIAHTVPASNVKPSICGRTLYDEKNLRTSIQRHRAPTDWYVRRYFINFLTDPAHSHAHRNALIRLQFF